MKLTEKQIETLYLERCKIEKFCEPAPLTVEEIVRRNWIAKAQERKQEIDEKLAAHFFPKPAEEGAIRLDAEGYHVMLKPSVVRVFDLAALPVIEAKLTPEQKAALIDYKPSLKLKAYRDMPESVQKVLDNAIIKTPGKTIFDITRNEA